MATSADLDAAQQTQRRAVNLTGNAKGGTPPRYSTPIELAQRRLGRRGPSGGSSQAGKKRYAPIAGEGAMQVFDGPLFKRLAHNDTASTAGHQGALSFRGNGSLFPATEQDRQHCQSALNFYHKRILEEHDRPCA
jgi:hypothetical protein